MNNTLREDTFMIYNELDESEIYKYKKKTNSYLMYFLSVMTKKGFQKDFYLSDISFSSKLALSHS